MGARQARRFRRRRGPPAFVFDNLNVDSGVGAVLAVSVFLDRRADLDTGAEREATRDADHAALATLASRGVTTEERKKIRELVKLVETTPAPVEVQAVDQRLEALTELYAWVQDWSDCARSVITRRDQLLRLGIGKRRPRGSSAKTATPPAPVNVVAPVAPVVAPVAPVPALPPAPPVAPTLLEIAQRSVAALPAAQLNGKSNGAVALPANGGAHGG